MIFSRYPFLCCLLILSTSILSSCYSTTSIHGIASLTHQLTILEETQASQTTPLTQNDVSALMGPPSFVETLSHKQYSVWYYYYIRREQVAFFRPQTKDSQLIALTFDTNKNLTDSSLAPLGRKIVMRKETTPTQGKELNLWETLFGNIGRFNQSRTIE